MDRVPMRQKFMTSSVPLAAFLEIKLGTVAIVDFDPAGRHPVVIFEDGERLRFLVKQYFAEAEVPAKKLADGSATLRSRFDQMFDDRRKLRFSSNNPRR
jgi:hypothetical protein